MTSMLPKPGFGILLFLTVYSAQAQWNPKFAYQTAVGRHARSEFLSRAVSDGSGGAIALFVGGEGLDLYAQRIGASGTTLWSVPAQPLFVTQAPNRLDDYALIADGQGGAFLAWSQGDATGSHIYVQRISASGQLLWGNEGVGVSQSNWQRHMDPLLVSDGAGGAYVVWTWDNGVNRVQLLAQRLDANGQMLWPLSGVQVATAEGSRLNPKAVRDHEGGLVVAFVDTRNDPQGNDYEVIQQGGLTNADIYAQRLSAGGEKLWGAAGKPVVTEPGNQGFSGMGPLAGWNENGLMVAYDDDRQQAISGLSNSDIYAQMLSPDGEPAWPAGGVAIAAAPGRQLAAGVLPMPLGGWLVGWLDSAASKPMIRAQRLLANGQPGWAASGISVSHNSVTAQMPDMLLDSDQQPVFVFEASSGNQTTRIQKLNTNNGALLYGPGGVSIKNNRPSHPSGVAGESGRVIVLWEDLRNTATGYDIYAARVSPGGSIESSGPAVNMSVMPGNWSNASTWKSGQVPLPGATVVLDHDVIIDQDIYSDSLSIRNGARVEVMPGVRVFVHPSDDSPFPIPDGSVRPRSKRRNQSQNNHPMGRLK